MAQLQVKDKVVDEALLRPHQAALLVKIRTLQQALANMEDYSILHAVYEQRLYESIEEEEPKTQGQGHRRAKEPKRSDTKQSDLHHRDNAKTEGGNDAKQY